METVLRFTAQDWARSRFVRSRLWDTVGAVRVLTLRHMQQLHRPWLATLDSRAISRALPVLVALNPAAAHSWVPDFLAPPARSTTASLADELAQVASYPLDSVSSELRRALDSNPIPRRAAMLEPLIANPAAARDRIVAELTAAYELLVASIWPRIEELVTADIAHHSAVIARAGLAAAVDDLYADVRRDGDVLRIRHGEPITLDLAGQGLALMPSAFVWPHALLIYDSAGWPPTLAYPARGIAEMWTEPPRPSNSLAALLGGTRAALLADLGRPRTTRELAERHKLAAATVSEHLTVLYQSRLLTRRRDRKEVGYQRTSLAAALLRGTSEVLASQGGRG